jgi:hypothetical protein
MSGRTQQDRATTEETADVAFLALVQLLQGAKDGCDEFGELDEQRQKELAAACFSLIGRYIGPIIFGQEGHKQLLERWRWNTN